MAIVSGWIGTANAAAGRTPTAYSVSNSGEAQYTIPIFAPQGANGMVPQIALSYSHRSGGMLFGEGWNLGGLSAITVCPKTWAQDGQARTVWLDGNDRFCLDGQQLKLDVASAAYGTPGAVYRTELESYSRIKSYGVTGNTPDFFTVETKDGLVYDYGSRGDSRIESVGSATAHTWALTTIRDRAGNRIEFYYAEDSASSIPAEQGNGGFRISSVTWTTNANAGVSPSYQMAFVYANQPVTEIESGFLAGGITRDIKRATQINVTYNGASVRRYNLAYESALSSTGKSRLASVTECGGSAGTDCLPATTFTYQNGTPGLGAQAATGFSAAAIASVMTLDVNGDGLSDLVYSSSATSGAGNWMLALGNGTSSFATPVNTGIVNNSFDRALPIDYNGDGREDFLVPYSGGTWWVVLGTSTGLSAPTDTGAAVWSTAGNAKAIDINGDGLEDLVEGDIQAVWFRPREISGTFGSGQYLVGPLNTTVTTIWGQIFADQGMKRRTRAPDFNGDGHGDFLVSFTTWEGGSPSDYSTQIVLANTGLVWGTTAIPWANQVAADVNADGYTDLLYELGGYWFYALSVGTAFGALEPGPVASGMDATKTLVLDWDGDGYEDLLVAGTNGYWQLMRSTGEGLSTPVNTSHYFGNLGAITVGDYNGDNLDDILYTNAAGNFGVFPHGGVAPDLLNTATDGYGNVVNFDYTTLAQGHYQKQSDATFPYQDYQGPLYVVSQYTAPDANSGTYTMSFWYFGAWLNRQGRGFQAFFAMRPYDSRSGIWDYRYFQRGFPLTGQQVTHELHQPNWTTFGRSVRDVDSHPLGSGTETRYFPYAYFDSQDEWEVAGAANAAHIRTTENSYTIDSATGSTTAVTTTINEHSTGNGVNGGRTWSRQTLTPAASFFTDWTNWCIGRPQITQQVQSHKG